MEQHETIDDLLRRISNTEEEVHSLRVQLDQSNKSMQEILEIVRTGKDFFRYIGYIGTALKWIVAVCAPVVAIIMTMKGKNAG